MTEDVTFGSLKTTAGDGGRVDAHQSIVASDSVESRAGSASDEANASISASAPSASPTALNRISSYRQGPCAASY